MCGISAIINQHPASVSPVQLAKMNNKIKHRGPDGEGFYFDENIALGHRMLKITDLSDCNRQPMQFRDYVITYNGEIYNYRSLREELKKCGYVFTTNTDTEVILAAYDKWQEECISYFKGMWAFALYDKGRKKIFCSRDRFGIKPLCYTIVNHQFLVGSEIKQFTVFNDFHPRLNNRIAYGFLYEGRLDASAESFFQHVNYVPAGHNLTYYLSTHKFELKRWYDLEKNVAVNRSISLDDAIEYFKELFTESILQHSYAKVPVGSCLSGGLDTTSIVGVGKRTGNDISTYSSCIDSPAYNEIRYIDKAVSYFCLRNKKVYPEVNELLTNNLLDKMVYQQDQPILSGSFFSEYKVFEIAASENMRVILSGQGADEYLGGYIEFYKAYLNTLLRHVKLNSFIKELNTLKTDQYPDKLAFILNFFSQFSMVRKLGSFLRGNANVKAASTDSFNPDWINLYTGEIRKHKNKNIRQLSIDALLNYSLPHQLHSEDRNSMCHSIESRLPFLDHRLVEFCLSLPDSFKIKDGVTKMILRESLKDVLPTEIYNRHWKLGFPGPEEPIFLNHSDKIKQVFKNCVNEYPEIFHSNLLQAYEAYLAKKIPYDPVFFRILSFAAWLWQFNIAGIIRSSKKISVLATVLETAVLTI